MPLTRQTLTLPAAFAVVALALAGCGGGSGDSSKSASKDEYATALNQFCTSFTQGAAKVQSAAAKIPKHTSPQRALGTFAAAIDDYATTIRKGVRRLDGSNAPSEYQSFNDGAVKGFTDAAGRLEKAAGEARRGDVKVLSRIGRELGEIDVPNPPKDLQQKATACRG